MATNKKQIPLRIPSALADALAAWAEEDLRSLNSQIEWILSDAVRKHRKIKEKPGWQV